jgi:FAD/FMN-containing dehydrogenase
MNRKSTTKNSLVVDNLRNVEMVLASGEIVQANAEVNSDLFWAIRGIPSP